MDVRIHNLDLGQWMQLARPDADIAGRVDSEIHLRGTAKEPRIDGELVMKSGRFLEFGFQSWRWDFHYADDQLRWNFRLQRDAKESMKGDGYLPLHLTFTGDENRIYLDRPIRIQASTGGLSLAFLQTITSDVRKVDGRFVCDIRLENTLADPRPIGFLRVINGRFQIPKLGVDYRDLQVALTVDSSQIRLVQFELAGGRGRMEVQGGAEYERQGVESRLKSAEFVITAKNFQVTRHKNLEAVIEGQARVFGGLESPRFDGEIRVLRSRVNLSAFQNSELFDEETGSPLLRVITREQETETDTGAVAASLRNPYLEALRGSLKIYFPRNTWLRDEDMNVEIQGQIDLVKSSPEFEHFGQIRVLRGSYDLYGKRFKIEKGVITFEGGLEFNPTVEIEAKHVFRSLEREKKELRLFISGRMFNPKLRFELDGREIEERDAIAYLLFRRSFDVLTQGERSQLAQEQSFLSTSTATSLLAGLMAAQLSRTLGRELNLDVIDLQGDNDWRQATIVLGKYLTNDLFLSYERQVQLGQSDEVVPEKVVLEYEITPFLLLQLTKGDRKSTGFDLIWKFEKK